MRSKREMMQRKIIGLFETSQTCTERIASGQISITYW